MANKVMVLMLNDAITEIWQHVEQMHLSKQQIGIIRDLRQIELLRNYLEGLCGL